ncbi:LysR family transcriptional regulator [Pseudomonas fluorescens]|uniref:HTH-type transcriptional regulator CynR n=1 Tax=Pseudomonas fluorescens TaxID=294 RepID=A0A5E7VV21_PSEFL|nr:LysR family transcriptional regulator [Pseudomonas fluorescens]VVQ26524.1 HTH-type transcriptional regulator CynR [Pseudomonas fluorescens]
MNFDLADLRGFLAVADLGSFSAAAQAMHLSQSALSRRVDKLEIALGVKLFERTTRRVELSTIGRGFVPRARNVLNELENALIGFHDLSHRLSGEVTIACVPSAVAYFLPDVIAQYHAKYPGIRIRVIDESSSTILTVVARGEADFGLTYIGTQDSEVVFQPLLEEDFIVALRVGHPLTARPSLTWDDLSGSDYISLAQGSGNRFLIDQALAKRDVCPRSFCEVKHVPALVSLVEAGLGIGVVPKLAMPADGHPTLVTRPLTDPYISRTLGLISRRGRALSPVAQLLFDLLMTRRKSSV